MRQGLVVSALELFDAFCTGSLLGPIGVRDNVAEPLKDGRRDNQVLEDIGEPAGQYFFARVRLRTFSAVASAVVVHVLALLQLADQQATAMPAMHQTGLREIVLDFTSAIRGPIVAPSGS